jgi:pyruvate-formate lyase-activating enzyme
MSGRNSIRLLRARLFCDQRWESGQWWYLPFREALRFIQRGMYRHRIHSGVAKGTASCGSPPCPVPFREMVINCDGTVACGSTAEAPLLAAFEEQAGPKRLSSVWDGPAFRAMRTRILSDDSSGCKGCRLQQNPGFAALSAEELRQGPKGAGSIQHLLIEPTAQCNLDCPTVCGHSYPRRRQPAFKRKTRFLPLDLFKQIVEGLDRPVGKICFYNYGEPLLHPDFFTMCEMIRARCPSTHIVTSTNGTRLKEAAIRAGLLRSGLDEMIVSVDGATQSSYEAYRRGGRLDEILEGMRLLKEERDRAGLTRPKIVWRYILFSWNDSEGELAQAEESARAIGVDRFCYHLSDLSELASRVYRPGTPAFERIQAQLY